MNLNPPGATGSAHHPPRLVPAQVLVLAFAALIAAGTLLLSLPQASATGQSVGLVNALFTATSAVCVTGLVVLDTGTDWSLFGQVVILFLIQVGGLGIMTMSTLIALILGKRITLRDRLLIQEAMGHFTLAGLVRLVRVVLAVSLALEAAGAVILSLRFMQSYSPGEAWYLGVFHAVSGFVNAGFSPFPDSLMGFREDFAVNAVMAVLIITGGLGFVVIADLLRRPGEKFRLTLHTRLVLVVSGILLGGGTALIYALESSNPATLGSLPPAERLMASFFHSLTPRTAGFNTLPVAEMREPTLFITIVLMFIGGSPSSTAGGIKTTTFAVLLLTVWAIIRGHSDVYLFERRLDRGVVERALAIAVTGMLLIGVVVVALLVTERAGFLTVLFEATSAFGTVGLSMGLTPGLTVAGRLLITATMFVGRLGLLALAVAVAHRQRQPVSLRYPEERVIVG